MLPSTPEEKQAIIDYMNWQAPDLKVEFLQKVYVENIVSHQHAVWDVHTNVDRWWVITNAVFPRAPLSMQRADGLSLIDGTHRMAAFVLFQMLSDAQLAEMK